MTIYPNGIDSVLQLPTVPGSSVEAIAINAVRDAAIAVETELGILPKGIYSDVSTRLAILESRIGPGPVGSVGGLIDAGTQLVGIVKIVNGGTGLASIGSANTILSSTGSSLIYKLLDNSNVSSSAAIDGYKINPDFGNQIVVGSRYTLGTGGPTITKGSGVPSSTEPNGSIFLRTDGTSLTGLYTRQSSTWNAVGYNPPTGTGFVHITSGSQDSAAKLVVNSDVDAAAAIAGTKISPSFGSQSIVTTGGISLGTNPAVSGTVKLPNNSYLQNRNAANTADIATIGVDSSNNIAIGLNSANQGNIALAVATGQSITAAVAGTTLLTVNGSGISTTSNISANAITFGAIPATTGQIRLSNAQGVWFRNAANSANLPIFTTDASDNLVVGTNTTGATLTLKTPATLTLQAGSVVNTLDTSLNTFPQPIATGTNPATTGQIRIPNNTVIAGRNAANTADINLVQIANTNDVYIGQQTAGGIPNARVWAAATSGLAVGGNTDYVIATATAGVAFASGSTQRAVIDSSKAGFWVPLQLGTNGANYAGSGLIRTANNPSTIIAQRNGANNGNLVVLQGSATDLFIGSGLGGTEAHTNVYLQGSTSANLAVGGTSVASFTSTLNTFTNSIAIGTNPASTGAIRLANSQYIYSRDSSNTADIPLIGANSGTNDLYIGSNVGTPLTGLYLRASVGRQIGGYIGGSLLFTVEATLNSFTNPIAFGTTPATAGQLRVPYNGGTSLDILMARNSANTGNVPIIQTNGTITNIGDYNNTTSTNIRGSVIGVIGSSSAFLQTNGFTGTYVTGVGLQLLSATPSFGGGTGVIGITNATVNPTTNPTGGVVLYSDSSDGYLKYRKPDGTTISLNGGGGGGLSISGTGLVKVVSGVIQSAAALLVDADVSSSAAIAGTKITPSFGAQNITTTGVISVGTNPATTGCVRIPNNNPIQFRNVANTADLNLIIGDGADNVQVGSGSIASLYNTSSTNVYQRIGSTIITSVSSTGMNMTTGSLSFGSLPASAGTIRLPSQSTISYRNFANTADFSAVSTDASNNVFFGDASNQGTTYLRGPTQVGFIVSGSAYVTLTSSALAMTPAITWGSNVAAAGLIKFGNSLGTVMAQRNAANSADLVFLSLNTTDGYIGSTNGKGSNLSNIHIAPSTSTNIYTGSTLQASFTSSLASFTQPIAIGTNSATTGTIRLANNSSIYSRDSTNATDIPLLTLDSSNVLSMGFNNSFLSGFKLQTHSAVPITLAVGATTSVTFANTLNTFVNAIAIGSGTFATSGQLRFVNAAGVLIGERDSSNTSNYALLSVGSSTLALGGDGGAANRVPTTRVIADSLIEFRVGSTATTVAGASFDGYTLAILSQGNSPAIAIGATPATAGLIRVPYATSTIVLGAKDSGGTDRAIISQNTTNNIRFGTLSSFNAEVYGGNVDLYGNSRTAIYNTNGSGFAIKVDSTAITLGMNLATFDTAMTTPKIAQVDNTTNSATAQALKIQAQNATGTTATGGALNLTSGTGTSTHGALNLQIGGTSKFSIAADGYNTVTSASTATIYSGNSKVTITEVIANVQTTDATQTTIASGTIPAGISAFDAIVTAIKSDNSQGACYKRAITFRNNAGTVATIGAVTDNGTFEDDSTWDCTIDNSTTTWRVRVTGVAATTIQWHCVVRRSEGTN